MHRSSSNIPAVQSESYKRSGTGKIRDAWPYPGLMQDVELSETQVGTFRGL